MSLLLTQEILLYDFKGFLNTGNGTGCPGVF
jgi:hypothetical protein